MYARVTTWEGVSPEAMKAGSEQINSADGPPPGVPSDGITMLHDPKSGRSLVIGLFETEDDLKTGDAALRAMDRPPIDGMGDITSIEFWEVGVDRRRTSSAARDRAAPLFWRLVGAARPAMRPARAPTREPVWAGHESSPRHGIDLK